MRARLAAALAIATTAVLAAAGCDHHATGTASGPGTCLGVTISPAAGSATPIAGGPATSGSVSGPDSGSGAAPTGAGVQSSGAAVVPSGSGVPDSGGAASSVGGAGGAANPGGERVPNPEIACYDGSGDVRLDNLTRPAVISLWASWCAPCREELPQIAVYATAAGPGITVIGVDTADTRTGADSMISDDHLGYPMLFDPDQRLLHGVGRSALPLTLFVAPGGVIRHVYIGAVTPIDQRTLTELAARYLGVRQPG